MRSLAHLTPCGHAGSRLQSSSSKCLVLPNLECLFFLFLLSNRHCDNIIGAKVWGLKAFASLHSLSLSWAEEPQATWIGWVRAHRQFAVVGHSWEHAQKLWFLHLYATALEKSKQLFVRTKLVTCRPASVTMTFIGWLLFERAQYLCMPWLFSYDIITCCWLFSTCPFCLWCSFSRLLWILFWGLYSCCHWDTAS